MSINIRGLPTRPHTPRVVVPLADQYVMYPSTTMMYSPRNLSATWTLEVEKDLIAYHGESTEIDSLVEQIIIAKKKELDNFEK